MAEHQYKMGASARSKHELAPRRDLVMHPVADGLGEQCLIQWGKLIVAKPATGYKARNMGGS